jgi:RNA polymerase-binding protein DksA
MNQRDQESFRQVLRDLGRHASDREDRLKGDALRPSGARAPGGTASAPGDAGDLSADQSQQDVSLGLLETQYRILEQVAAALDRIDNGTFGSCTDCGREISRERLRAVPYAPFCVDCARRRESAGEAAD